MKQKRELRKCIRSFAREKDLDAKKLHELFKKYFQNGSVKFTELQKDFGQIDFTYSSAFLELAARLNPDEAGAQNAFLLKVITEAKENSDYLAKLFFGPTSEKRGTGASKKASEVSEEEILEKKAEEIVKKVSSETPAKSKTKRRPRKPKGSFGRFLEAMMSMIVGKVNIIYPEFYDSDHPEYYELLGITSKFELDIIPLQLLLVENRLLRLQVKPEYREIVEKYEAEKKRAQEIEEAQPQELEDWMSDRFSLGFDKAEDAAAQCAFDYAANWLHNEDDTEWWRSRTYSDNWSEKDELRASLLHQGYAPPLVEDILNEFFIEEDPVPDSFESQLEAQLSSLLSS